MSNIIIGGGQDIANFSIQIYPFKPGVEGGAPTQIVYRRPVMDYTHLYNLIGDARRADIAREEPYMSATDVSISDNIVDITWMNNSSAPPNATNWRDWFSSYMFTFQNYARFIAYPLLVPVVDYTWDLDDPVEVTIPMLSPTEAFRGYAQATNKVVFDLGYNVRINSLKNIYTNMPIYNIREQHDQSPGTNTGVSIRWNSVDTSKSPVWWENTLMGSLKDSIYVDSGETVTTVIEGQGASYRTVTGELTPVPYIPFEDGKYDLSFGSCYTVTGADGYVISPQRWLDNGGKVTFRRLPHGQDYEVTIRAADIPELSPFTITEGPDFPALYIVGEEAVSFEPRTTSFSRTLDPQENIDEFSMPFVLTEEQAYSALLRYLPRMMASLETTLSFEVAVTHGEVHGLGLLVGGIHIEYFLTGLLKHKGRGWRITSFSYNAATQSASVVASEYTSFEMFNEEFGDKGMSFADYNNYISNVSLADTMDFALFSFYLLGGPEDA